MLKPFGEFVVLLCLVVTIIFDDYGPIGGTEMQDIPMTEKQASVLPTVIEDAEALRESRAISARGARLHLDRVIALDEQEDIERWSKIVADNDIEHYRACRLVAFLEKLAGGEA